MYPFRKHFGKYVITKEKKELLKHLSKKLNKNITHIESLFLDSFNNFGNQLAIINKAIFYCEILQCKQIILNKDYFWYITNKIFHTYKNNLTMIIEPANKKDYQNNTNILFDYTENFFDYDKYIRPEYRMEVIKNEILMNLPQVNINSEDLYIYIRSGDVFEKLITGYFQPPYAFIQLF